MREGPGDERRGEGGGGKGWTALYRYKQREAGHHGKVCECDHSNNTKASKQTQQH